MDRGISLRKLNIAMFLTAAVISLVLFWSMQRTSEIYEETHTVTQRLVVWRRNSYDLQLASDFLTEEIQGFAATGEKKHLDRYFWEAKIDRRRDRALRELQDSGVQPEAIESLKGAMTESMELMQREYHAARLVVDAYDLDIADFPFEIQEYQLSRKELSMTPAEKKEEALQLLFGVEYHQKKDAISGHMHRCLSSLTDDMIGRQNVAAAQLRSQVWIEHFLTVLLIAITLGIVFLTAKLVIFPLQRCVEMIRDEKDIPLKGAYEVQFLAKTYNLMHHTNLESKEKLTYEATHDNLTGLYNRRGYDFLLQNVDMETSALLLFDLDKFKQVNDTYGHDAGDRVLMKAAEAIFCSFRTQDYVCRIGGDEFAVIMVHADPSLKELLRNKARKINEKLSQETEDTPAITASMGVAFGYDGVSLEDLFKQADTSLYKAKENEEINIAFYSRTHAG